TWLTGRTASPDACRDIGRSASKLRPFGQCGNGRHPADVNSETRRWRGAARPPPPRRVLLSVWLDWLIGSGHRADGQGSDGPARPPSPPPLQSRQRPAVSLPTPLALRSVSYDFVAQ